jgi:hypothetical protein
VVCACKHILIIITTVIIKSHLAETKDAKKIKFVKWITKRNVELTIFFPDKLGRDCH